MKPLRLTSFLLLAAAIGLAVVVAAGGGIDAALTQYVGGLATRTFAAP